MARGFNEWLSYQKENISYQFDNGEPNQNGHDENGFVMSVVSE